MSFGQGSVTMVYRPIAFDGTLTVSHIRLGDRASARTARSAPRGGIEVQPDPRRRASDRPSRRPTAADRLPEAAAGRPVRRHARGRAVRPDRRGHLASPAPPQPGPDLRCRGRRRGTSTRAPARSSSGSSTTARTRSTSSSACRSRGRSSDRHRRHPRPRQALSGHARGRRPRPDRRRGRDLRPGRSERRRQDDDAPDPRDAPAGDLRARRGRRHRRPAEPRRRTSRPRLHAGRLRGLRRHEGLGVPRLLRPLLRHPGARGGGG